MRRTGDIFEQESYRGEGSRNMLGVSLAMIICSLISVLAAIFIIVNFKAVTVRIANCSDLSHYAVEVENAQTLLEMVRRKGRDYQMVTVWSIIKRFIFGWLLTGVLLVIVSCVKYKEFIITAFTNNMWAWVNAVMPIIIIILGIGYMIKSLFR